MSRAALSYGLNSKWIFVVPTRQSSIFVILLLARYWECGIVHLFRLYFYQECCTLSFNLLRVLVDFLPWAKALR